MSIGLELGLSIGLQPINWAAYWAGHYVSALTVVVDSDAQVTLNWTNNGDASYTGHKTYISTDNITYTLAKTVATIQTSMVIDGLSADTIYYFKVAPYKGINIGSYSNLAITVSGYTSAQVDAALITLAAGSISSAYINFKGTSEPRTVASDAAVATLTGVGRTCTVVTYNLGAELVTNGNFAAWTTDNPNGWTVSGESGTDPEISEVGTGEGHGGAGTGFCNIYTTGVYVSIDQTILTATKRYRISINVNKRTSGAITIGTTFGGTDVVNNLITTGVSTYDVIAAGTQLSIRRGLAAAANDMTIDDVSVKEIT